MEKYASGKPKIVNYFTDIHHQNYIQKEFAEEGYLSRERTFIAAKQEGFEYGFYATGEKGCEIMYKNGVRNGVTHEFHKNGQIRFEGHCYLDSGYCGRVTTYYDNGKLQSVGFMRKNNDIGERREYYINGKLRRVLNFDGVYKETYFDTNGVLTDKMNFNAINLEK